MIITNLSNESELLTDFSNVSIKQKINADYNLHFSLFNTSHNVHSYPLVQEESLVDLGEEQFVVKSIMDGPYNKSITAVHSFFECIHDYVDDYLIDGLYTIQQALDLAFSTSEWGYTVVGSFPQATLYDFGNNNAVALLNTILETWHVEYERSAATKRIIIKQQLGVQTDFQIRYRHNLKTISRSINSENLKTAVTVYFNLDDFGEYQSSIIYYSPRVNHYRRPKWAEPIYLDDVTTESAALAYARQNLKDTPDVSITAELIELIKAGYELNDVQLGNSMYLIDERMSINDLARIVEIENFPYDSTRSPIVTISTVKKNLMDAVVQQKIEQRQLAKTAVKQKVIYNGCTITPEEGFKATAENGVVTYLNATQGIAIIKNEVYKFYVSTDGELILDGKLQITANGVTMLESYMDDAGGILKIRDIGGALNVEIGSNKFDALNTGGSLYLYSDGEYAEKLRCEIAIDRAEDAGFIQLSDNNARNRVSIEASENVSGKTRIRLRSEDGEDRTEIFPGEIKINSDKVITKSVLDAAIDDLKERIRELKDYVNEQDDWLWEEIDDLWRAMLSGD
ncbi:MAG: phage tail protein [Solibacillus sp.]